MIYSANFSSKTFVIVVAIMFYLSGCGQRNGPPIRSAHDSLHAEKNILIAVLPFTNSSGVPAPLSDIRQLFLDSFKEYGVTILENKVLETFMTNNRIRYVGGVDLATAQDLKWKTGAEAALVTTLELYSEEPPPKIALVSRLVSTGNDPTILWMDGIGLAGDDSIGLLELSLIKDPRKLLQNVVRDLTASLTAYLSGREDRGKSMEGSIRLWPSLYHRSPIFDSTIKYRVAVAPFLQLSERRNAGNIMALHFVRLLRAIGSFSVIEPGLVRDTFLQYRIIMDDGLSLAQADILFSKLDADLILAGKIFDYQDYVGLFGRAKVDFSALLIERKSREVVWSCESHHVGDEGVFFFDWGKIHTAHKMASGMVVSALETLVE